MQISRYLVLSSLGLLALGACSAPDVDDAPAPGVEASAAAPGVDVAAGARGADAEATAPGGGLTPVPFCQDVIWYETRPGTCEFSEGGGVIVTCSSKCVIDKALKLDDDGSLDCKVVSATCAGWVCPCPNG